VALYARGAVMDSYSKSMVDAWQTPHQQLQPTLYPIGSEAGHLETGAHYPPAAVPQTR